MIISLVGIITCLIALAIVFYEAAAHAPRISFAETSNFGVNSTCPAYTTAQNPASWNCMTCLKGTSGCAFCANQGNEVNLLKLLIVFAF